MGKKAWAGWLLSLYLLFGRILQGSCISEADHGHCMHVGCGGSSCGAESDGLLKLRTSLLYSVGFVCTSRPLLRCKEPRSFVERSISHGR